MTGEKKVVQLTKVSTLKDEARTYEKCLLEHLDKLSEVEKNRIPISMMTIAITEDGIVYVGHAGDDIAQMMGMLDITKQYLFSDFLNGDLYE